VGAINRNSDGYNFTNAGMLFFAANPQRVLWVSFIRLLRFEADVENIEDRGLPTFDRKFMESITKQVRDIRAFFRESGFFKLYQTRNPDGGFLEVPCRKTEPRILCTSGRLFHEYGVDVGAGITFVRHWLRSDGQRCQWIELLHQSKLMVSTLE
jgi:hypothetical protein